MSTAAEQYRALVNRLESITEAPVDPRSQEERDSQMAAVKNAFQDYEAAEKAAAAKPAAKPAAPAAQPATATDPKLGELVKKLQTVLNAKGAQLQVDGVMGPKTIEAVIAALGTPAQAAQPAAAPAPQAAPTQPAAAAGPMDPFAKGGLFNR